MSLLADEALKVARQRIGIHEDPLGSNSGPEVTAYLKEVGLGPGYSWCMAFVFSCVDQAAKNLKVPNPLYKTAGVLAEWNNRPAFHVKSPLSGDIFILDFGHGAGHTGFVEYVSMGGAFWTIEGNSNNDGSRNGTTVVRHLRHQSDKLLKGFLRF